MALRPWLTALAALFLPRPLARVALCALGHAVGPGVRIGFSLLLVDRLVLQGGARIGHFNLVRARRVVMRRGAYINRGNLINGPLSLALGKNGVIGNRNKIVRAPLGVVTVGPSMFRTGELAGITSDHYIDCTTSVRMGNFSSLAGIGTQVWTHGYVHDEQGAGRYRVDGGVRIGHNVYVGSSCIVTTGVELADNVIVGAGTTVARSLLQPGMYVSAGLRHLDRPPNPDLRTDLKPVVDPRLSDRVYTKQVTR